MHTPPEPTAIQPPLAVEHSFTSVWQNELVHVAGHVHVKPFVPSTQVPPLMQGCEAHWTMLVWQRTPLKPAGHVQWKPPAVSRQVPP